MKINTVIDSGVCVCVCVIIIQANFVNEIAIS